MCACLRACMRACVCVRVCALLTSARKHKLNKTHYQCKQLNLFLFSNHLFNCRFICVAKTVAECCQCELDNIQQGIRNCYENLAWPMNIQQKSQRKWKAVSGDHCSFALCKSLLPIQCVIVVKCGMYRLIQGCCFHLHQNSCVIILIVWCEQVNFTVAIQLTAHFVCKGYNKGTEATAIVTNIQEVPWDTHDNGKHLNTPISRWWQPMTPLHEREHQTSRTKLRLFSVSLILIIKHKTQHRKQSWNFPTGRLLIKKN